MNTPQPNFFLKNPWADLPKDDLHKTTVSIDRVVLSKITRVHSKQGVLQATFYQLLYKLTNELERIGLTEYDAAGYERAVANCTITLGLGSPAGVPATGRVDTSTQQVPQGHDGRGTPSLARPVPRPPAVHDNAESPRKPRRKRGEAKGTQGGEETVARE